MPPLIEARGLALLRGERRLFGPLDFALSAGELLVVEGANGSGKTSLLGVVAGLLTPDAGEFHWQGRAVTTQRQAWCAAFAWYGHRAGLKADLTPRENLAMERALGPASAATCDQAMARLGVTRLANLPLRVLSAGQQRRVALCRLLLAAAPVWLLDEPYTNLDRDGQALVDDLIREHLDAGGLAIVASHRAVDIDGRQSRLVLN